MITTKTRDSDTGSGRAAAGLGDGPAAARPGATTMKAVVQDTYGTSEVLELQDIAKPEIGDSEVLVRVRGGGVNPGDWALMGGLPYIARPVYGLRKPKNRVRGTDVAGQGEGVGAGGTRVWPGGEGVGLSQPRGGGLSPDSARPLAA